MEVEESMRQEKEHPSAWGETRKEQTVWVKANVSGKVYNLEAESWGELIILIEKFIKDFGHLRISWGDLFWG